MELKDAEHGRSFPARHPYRFITLLELAVLAVFILAGTVVQVAGLPELVLPFAANIVLSLLGLLLLARFGWLNRVGFLRRLAPRQLALYVVPFALILYFVASGFQPMEPGLVVAYLFMALLIGIAEEVIYRGLMLHALLPRGIWAAAIISSVVFGLTHGLNALAGSAPLYVLLQLAYSTAVGFAFAALMIRTRAIWPLILIHFLIDFTAFLSMGGIYSGGAPASEIVLDVVVTVVFAAYGVYLLSTMSQKAAESTTRSEGPLVGTAESKALAR